MKSTKLVFLGMGIVMMLTGCGSTKSVVEVPATSVDEASAAEETDTVEETVVEETAEATHPEDELYEQFIEGTITDVNGENCSYAKNDPYYEDFIDLEWAIYDLNGDGTNELIPRMYRGYISEIYSCQDGAIVRTYTELFGSEGGFINDRNQMVATDCSHANRNQYLVTDYVGEGKTKSVIFFAKWWLDEENPDDAEYVKYEGSDFWDIDYDDYTIITKDEYEALLAEYTNPNIDIVFQVK